MSQPFSFAKAGKVRRYMSLASTCIGSLIGFGNSKQDSSVADFVRFADSVIHLRPCVGGVSGPSDSAHPPIMFQVCPRCRSTGLHDFSLQICKSLKNCLTSRFPSHRIYGNTCTHLLGG